MTPLGTPVQFKTVLNALLDNNKPFPAIYLHQFSDMPKDDLTELEKNWLKINSKRRADLLEDLEELAESDTIVCFDDLARLALADPEIPVRVRAVNMLWEAEDRSLIPIFLKMLENDPSTEVRAAVASALGKFVLLGETEEIPQESLENIEDALLLLTAGSDPELIRRRALESLGFSHREEVIALIEKEFKSGKKDWLTSALFAMGRSADPRWEKQVLSMLTNTDEDVRYEAVRAAGELELKNAREILLNNIDEGIDDFDLRMATIWALSQIGGEGIRERIEDLLENCQEDDECNYLEEALDNLNFTDDFNLTNLFDFDVADEDDEKKPRKT